MWLMAACRKAFGQKVNDQHEKCLKDRLVKVGKHL